MDIRFSAFVLATAILVPSAGWSQQTPPPGQQAPPPASKSQMDKPAVSNPDAQFLKKAAEDNIAEVECATLASTKAQNEQVKSFASKLLTDHQENQSEVQSLASKKSVTLPTELPAAKKAVKDRLSKLEGAGFDKAYVSEMIKDHKQAISAFEKAAKSSDPDVKAYAEKTLPALKDHLAQAQAIKLTAPAPIK